LDQDVRPPGITIVDAPLVVTSGASRFKLVVGDAIDVRVRIETGPDATLPCPDRFIDKTEVPGLLQGPAQAGLQPGPDGERAFWRGSPRHLTVLARAPALRESLVDPFATHPRMGRCAQPAGCPRAAAEDRLGAMLTSALVRPLGSGSLC
jgi:hypothetical protein